MGHFRVLYLRLEPVFKALEEIPAEQPCGGDPQNCHGGNNPPIGGGGIVAEQGLAYDLEEMKQGIVGSDEDSFAQHFRLPENRRDEEG